MTLEADGLRGLVLAVAAIGLLTAAATRSLRATSLVLIPPALGLVTWLAVAAALPSLGPPFALRAAAPLLGLAAGLSLLAGIPREDAQRPAWPPGTWLLLHAVPLAAAWLSFRDVAPAQICLATALVVVAVSSAWLSERIQPSEAPFLDVEALSRGLSHGGVAVIVIGVVGVCLAGEPSLAWRPTLSLAGLTAAAVTLWAGRPEVIAPLLLPPALGIAAATGLAGWRGAELPPVMTQALLAVGTLLGLQVVGGRLMDARHDSRPSHGATLAAGLAFTASALALLLNEGPEGQAALPLALGTGVATLSATSLVRPLTDRIVRPPVQGCSIPRRYRWLGAWVGHYAWYRTRHDALLPKLPALAKGCGEVLVAGCGHGLSVVRLVTALPEASLRAVELDPAKLRRLEAALTESERARVTRVQGDLRQVELGSPDLIVLLDVLRAWPSGEQRELLAKLTQALKPGGRLLFRDGCPGPDGSHLALELGVRIAWWLGLDSVGPGPRFSSATDYGRRLNEAGLGVEKSFPKLGSAARLVLLCRKPKPTAPATG